MKTNVEAKQLAMYFKQSQDGCVPLTLFVHIMCSLNAWPPADVERLAAKHGLAVIKTEKRSFPAMLWQQFFEALGVPLVTSDYYVSGIHVLPSALYSVRIEQSIRQQAAVARRQTASKAAKSTTTPLARWRGVEPPRATTTLDGATRINEVGAPPLWEQFRFHQS
jgi:hypothetical protein